MSTFYASPDSQVVYFIEDGRCFHADDNCSALRRSREPVDSDFAADVMYIFEPCKRCAVAR